MIDYDRIANAYGKDILVSLKDYEDEVIKNFNYLKSLGFSDVVEIFELYPTIFICSNDEFQIKIKSLTDVLGSTYFEQLEEDINLWQIIA